MSRQSNIDFQNFLNGLNINPIPLEFTQALTTSEFLHTLLAYVKEVAESADNYNVELYREFERKFKELEKELERTVKNISVIEQYKKEIVQYISILIGDSLKLITFELDNDGYFVAYIPKEWNDINFDTILDTTSNDYGKLVVEY